MSLVFVPNSVPQWLDDEEIHRYNSQFDNDFRPDNELDDVSQMGPAKPMRPQGVKKQALRSVRKAEM